MIKIIFDIFTSKLALKMYCGVCFFYGTIKAVLEIEGNSNKMNIPKIITYGGISFLTGYICVYLEKYILFV
jgi:uncharacterized membrane protein YgdD (TMEM256/DUF423 family)